MGKRVAFDMIAVLLVATIIGFSAILLTLNYYSETQDVVVPTEETMQETATITGINYYEPLPAEQTFTITVEEESDDEEEADEEELSSSDQNTLDSAEDAIDEIDETLDD